MSKIDAVVFKRPDMTIRVKNEEADIRDEREEGSMLLYHEELYQSDIDGINMMMYYLSKMSDKFGDLSPAMKQMVAPHIGEVIKHMACRRDLYQIIWGAGGKVREV